MIRNYLKLAWRNLAKQKIYSVITISGLALAYSACILIFLFVREETSYDRQSADSDRIFRVVKDFVNDDGTTLPDATTPPALAPALQHDITQLESVTRIFPAWGTKFLVRSGDKSFYEPRVYRGDSNVFTFFSTPFLAGDPNTALKQSNGMVITETIAKKYFGTTDVLGKALEVVGGRTVPFVVTGVIPDMPSNMHFHFDILIPYWPDMEINNNWGFYNFYTYIKLKQGSSIAEVEPLVVGVYKKNRPQGSALYYTQALTDIHLNSKLKWELETNSDKAFITIFTTVGIFILLIAAVNYINLSIVQSLNRSKEVGIRKVSGANGGKLVNQFLLESFLVSLLALIVSLAIVETVIPMINKQFGNHLTSLYDLPLTVMLLIALGVFFVGLLSGLYPSIYLSAFKPIDVLKGVFQPSNQNLWLRKSLVILQFSISIALIAGAIIVFMQVDFLRTKELGFSKEQVIIVPNVDNIQEKSSLKESFRGQSGVAGAGSSNGVLGGQNWATSMVVKGNENGSLVNITAIDDQYLPVMGIQVVAGRNFVKGTDVQGGRGNGKVILNERAVKDLGITGDPIGTLITEDPEADTVRYSEVIGVTKDFHFASLKSEIKPYAFLFNENYASNFVVKAEAKRIDETLENLRKSWDEFAPGRPFDYYFLDDQFRQLYKAEENFKVIFTAFTAMAIYIACSGLFAIASYFIRRRTKEIGIRKVLGASVVQVTWLVSSEFLVIVGIANVLAWPVAWKFMDNWLNGFAYRIDLSLTNFLIAGLVALMIAMITVGFHSIRAARANPVNSLRNE
jgi:putative ABC transport system permease protein